MHCLRTLIRSLRSLFRDVSGSRQKSLQAERCWLQKKETCKHVLASRYPLKLFAWDITHVRWSWALCWLNSTRDYAYMRRVTNNNYSHFLRDIIWRSVLRDWPTRPVRLERWITDRDPTFFMALEQGSQLQFELAPEPSKLFEWDSCTDICGVRSL